MRPAPAEVTLKWCPVCGRDDRRSPLRARHFGVGRMCTGKPEPITYVKEQA